MNKIKKYVTIGLIVLGLCGVVYLQNNTIKQLNKEYATTTLNLKAYVNENKALQDGTLVQARQFQLTVDQMSQYSDSLLVKLNKYKRDLDIKDKDLKALQYIASNTKVDTIIKFKDSILVVGTKIDTTIRDNWFSLKMSLRYPDTIRVIPAFKNGLLVAIHATRETIEPPKKFFISRWFQEKQTIIVADVKDENPYTELGTQRFIQIVK